MAAFKDLSAQVGVHLACRALPVSRASYYRGRKDPMVQPETGGSELAPRLKRKRDPAGRGLSEEEQMLLNLLHSDRFADQAPGAVYSVLLSEGLYHGSVSTMYRLLARNQEVKERRDPLRHPAFTRPELLATGPNQVWSWDITRLKAANKWTYYYLYVIIDISSRYVVGWCIAPRESAELARELILGTCLAEGIEPGQLCIHADRGSAMTSKLVEQLLVDLGVVKTHSRPHVSNDNPYSEAAFKTIKCRPPFPERFGSQPDAEAFMTKLLAWYNTEHVHSGIAMLTPDTVHKGRTAEEIARREAVLMAAYFAHPERFVRHPPRHPALPAAAWINAPATERATDAEGAPVLQ